MKKVLCIGKRINGKLVIVKCLNEGRDKNMDLASYVQDFKSDVENLYIFDNLFHGNETLLYCGRIIDFINNINVYSKILDRHVLDSFYSHGCEYELLQKVKDNSLVILLDYDY